MKKNTSTVKSVFKRIAEIWRTIPVEEVGYPVDDHQGNIFKIVSDNSNNGLPTVRLICIAFNQR